MKMNVLEIVGALAGIAGIWLTARKNILCFPVGLVNVLITTWLVYEANLYADVLQQLMFAALIITGWIYWKKDKAEIIIGSIKSASGWWGYGITFILSTAFLYFILSTYTAASYPLWDSTGTVLSFIAQWMIAKRKIENWLVWMPVNIIYFVLYFVKDMPAYSILSAVYFVMAIMGYRSWKKKLII